MILSSMTMMLKDDAVMTTKNISQNGIYDATSEGYSGYETVNVNVYEKYNMLYWGNFTGVAYNHFFEDARTYDELWLIGYNITLISGSNKLCLWSSRYPVDAVYEFANKRFCMQGSDNYSWVTMNSDGYSATPIDQYGSCTPLAYIGVKNNEREQTLLWKNSETTTPDTITLSDSIFDYDEICLQFINSGSGQYNTAVWFSTSQLSINDTVYGYNDYNGYISKYTITAGDTLSKISEAGYRLYAIYGVNDSSMQETVLFTNPSDSTMPETVTLSDAYTNYDEIALIGHAINDGIKGSQYYPVKVIATGSSMQNMHSRVGIFTDVTNCWLEFTSDTTLAPNSSYGMIIDKIIGIKRPVVSNAKPFPVNYIDDNKGVICYDNSGVNPIGFKNTDKLESDYISMPTDTAVTVEFCGVVSTDDTYGRIWQIGTYNSVGNTFAYDNSGSSPMFELAIHDSWDTHQIDATDYLNTLVTVSIVIDSDTKVYINGTLVSDAIAFTKSDIVSDENEIRFLHGSTSSRAADGDIYAFRIYHRALTAAEVQQNVWADIYNFGSTT